MGHTFCFSRRMGRNPSGVFILEVSSGRVQEISLHSRLTSLWRPPGRKSSRGARFRASGSRRDRDAIESPVTSAETITVAHSPDSDDAFMFYALAEGRVDTEGLSFVHELSDIESLNRRAMAGELAVTAVSFHAYTRLADRYLLLPHGASFGDGYGPVVVARAPDRPRADRVGAVARGLAGGVDDGGARAPALGARRRHRAPCRSTESRRRCARASRSRPPDPRGPADVRRGGLHGGRRPRPVVEGRDGPAAAARRQRRAAGPRSRADRPHLARPVPLDRVRPGPPRRGPRPRHALRAGPRPREGRPLRRHVRQRLDAGATARRGGGPSSCCSTGPTPRA